MRAITITRYGPPSVLAVVEHPDPSPGEGEVRIRVAAAGLNFAEIAARQGLYPDAPPPPCVVGYEVAGTIEALGEGVQSLQIGQRVAALTPFGGHADCVVLPAALAFAIPEELDFARAAAIPVNYLTAHHMLFHVGNTHPGSKVLVHMAAGGVGTAVLQLLQTVDGICSFGTASAAKHPYIRELGCTHPIDYHSQDYVEEITRITAGGGLDLVLDPLGGRDWKRSWQLLAPTGRMVAFGFANMIGGQRRSLLRVVRGLLQIPRFSPMAAMNDNRTMQGVNMGKLWEMTSVMRSQMTRIIELFALGVVRPHVHAQVPFSRVAEAHAMLENRENRGKVVLVPD